MVLKLNQTELETLRGDDVQRGSDRWSDGSNHEPARLERVSGIPEPMT